MATIRKPRLSEEAASAAADAVCQLLNGGFLRIYSLNGTMLAELNFWPVAFQKAVAGVARSNPLAPEKSARESGEAVVFLAFQADGQTLVLSGPVGPDSVLSLGRSGRIKKGAEVSVSDFVYEQPR